MKKNSVTPILIFSLVLIVLPLLAGCQTVAPQGVAVAAPAGSAVDYQVIENAMLERWQAMARFYEDQSLSPRSLSRLSADEILAYRWEALGRFYTEHPFTGVALTELSAGNVCEYRWLAMARYYEQNPYAGVDLTALEPDEILAYRWLAIAKAYEK